MIQNNLAMKTLSITLFFLFLANLCFSQNELEIIPGEIIIQLEKGTDHQLFINKYLHSFNALSFKNTISQKMDLYLFEYNQEASVTDDILQKLQNLPLVNIAGFNFRMQHRSTIPDDPL